MNLCRRYLLRFVFIASVACPNLHLALSGQSLQDRGVAEKSGEYMPLTYDVASIRETEPTPPPRQRFSSPSHVGSLDAVLRLSQLVAEALDVNSRFQIAGGPAWLDQQNFTIHARGDTETDRQLSSLTDEQAKAEKRQMLLRLLQDRFGLTYHFEQRPGVTYFITPLKGTPGLRRGSEQAISSGIVSGGVPTDISLTGHAAKLSQFAGLMSYYLRAPVVDQTGLDGIYDFKVHFNARPDPLSSDTEVGPSPEQALSEQMGLKLVRGSAPVRIVVVDSVEKPTPN